MGQAWLYKLPLQILQIQLEKRLNDDTTSLLIIDVMGQLLDFNSTDSSGTVSLLLYSWGCIFWCCTMHLHVNMDVSEPDLCSRNV